jgi:hypothetical protein
MHSRIPALASALLTTGLVAQVPVGVAIHGAISNSAAPLFLVDRAGAVTNITGAPLTNINSLRVDPIDGTVWIASSAGGVLFRGAVAGTTFVNTFSAPGVQASVSAIAFDQDCNPILGGGTTVIRVDRHSGAVTTLTSLAGTVNALDEDPATGDIYAGAFGNGNVSKLSPPNYSAPALLGSIASVANTNLSGLSFARTPAAPLGTLYISTFGGTLNASLVTYDILGSTFAAVPGTPNWADLNWVDYDSVVGDLWANSTFAARSVYQSTVAGANTVLTVLPNGTPACVEVNDVNPAIAELTVCPMNAPTPAAPVTLELGVAGRPGEYAVIVVVVPFVALLASGPVDAGGRFSTAIPGVVVGSGRPGSVRFMAATIDLSTLGVKVANQVNWPLN